MEQNAQPLKNLIDKVVNMKTVRRNSQLNMKPMIPMGWITARDRSGSNCSESTDAERVGGVRCTTSPGECAVVTTDVAHNGVEDEAEKCSDAAAAAKTNSIRSPVSVLSNYESDESFNRSRPRVDKAVHEVSQDRAVGEQGRMSQDRAVGEQGRMTQDRASAAGGGKQKVTFRKDIYCFPSYYIPEVLSLNSIPCYLSLPHSSNAATNTTSTSFYFSTEAFRLSH